MAQITPMRKIQIDTKLHREVVKINWHLGAFQNIQELRILLASKLSFEAGDMIGFPSKWIFTFQEDKTSRPPKLGRYGIFLKLSEIPTNGDVDSIFVRFEVDVKGQDGTSFLKCESEIGEGSLYLNMGGGIRSVLSLTDLTLSDIKPHENGFVMDLSVTICGKKVKIVQNPNHSFILLQRCSLLAVGDDLEKLLDSGNHSDVKVVVRAFDENGEEVEGRFFNVHKAILAARSPVFFTMFENKMKESIEATVKIDDISYPAMDIILRFIYSGSLSRIWTDVADEVVNAAEKYHLKLLKDFCDKTLSFACTPENAIELRRLARQFNLQKALREINQFIKRNIDEVLSYDF